MPSAFSRSCRLVLVAAGLVSGAASADGQQEAPSAPRPDKSRYDLFHPTPREFMREMSTDRPDTTESPYTVDAGHFQVELSFIDFTYDYENPQDETRHSLAVAPALFKVGLLNNVDLQLGLDPYVRDETEDRSSGIEETAEGFGDTVVRLKVNLWGNDHGDTALALMPFVKLPTADSDLGNGDVEGGLIVPLAVTLPGDWSLGLMAEVDVVRTSADDGYSIDFVHTATVSHSIWGQLGGYVEYAGFENLSGDEDYRGYFDAGLTYGLTPDIQLDAGIRVGLTEASDDLGLFAGISIRL